MEVKAAEHLDVCLEHANLPALGVGHCPDRPRDLVLNRLLASHEWDHHLFGAALECQSRKDIVLADARPFLADLGLRTDAEILFRFASNFGIALGRHHADMHRRTADRIVLP